MKEGLGKKKYRSIIQVTIFVLCISSVCVAGVVEFTDEVTFKNDTGNPQYFIDFETYGDGTPVPPNQPTISGNEWSNLGIQFAAVKSGADLVLYNDPGSKGEYVSPIHTLDAWGDISSILITFSTPVVSFGVYIVDNETTSPTESIILKDENGNVLGNFAMPVGPSLSKDFRGYSSDTPIAEIHIIEDLDGEGLTLDNVMYSVPEPVLVVEIDIKPGSYPNAINLGSHGLTPVAIFSMVGFDATSVDPNTVNLAGAPVAIRGKNKFMAHEEDADGDGMVDLVVQVVTADINPALLQQDGDAVYAVLTGTTYDGETIEGEDEVTIVPNK